MAAFGKDAGEWFEMSRENRIFMTAAFVAERLIEAITNDDQAKELERKRKRRGRASSPKPKARRRR